MGTDWKPLGWQSLGGCMQLCLGSHLCLPACLCPIQPNAPELCPCCCRHPGLWDCPELPVVSNQRHGPVPWQVEGWCVCVGRPGWTEAQHLPLFFGYSKSPGTSKPCPHHSQIRSSLCSLPVPSTACQPAPLPYFRRLPTDTFPLLPPPSNSHRPLLQLPPNRHTWAAGLSPTRPAGMMSATLGCGRSLVRGHGTWHVPRGGKGRAGGAWECMGMAAACGVCFPAHSLLCLMFCCPHRTMHACSVDGVRFGPRVHHGGWVLRGGEGGAAPSRMGL